MRSPCRLVSIALLCSIASAPAMADVHKVGDRASELDTAIDAWNRRVKLANLRGKWVVLTIGAAWCIPCKAELPALDRLQNELRGKVIVLAVDVSETVAEGKAFHTKLKLRYMRGAYLGDKSAVAGNYGGDTMPTTFILDPKGVVRHVHAGYRAGDEKKLKDVLAKLVR